MHQPKLLVGISLLLTPCAFAADIKHKQPMARHSKGQFVAFAYNTGTVTAEGRKPVAGKTIAADTRVLPLGTRVRISGAGPWSGDYRVGDSGGRIKGRKIDLYVPTRAEALEFGSRSITLTVLELPKRSVATAGTRARKASEAMMAKNEVRGSRPTSDHRHNTPDRTPERSLGSDSGQDRRAAVVAGLSAFSRTSAH